MAAQGTGVAKFDKDINDFLTKQVGEGIIDFQKDDRLTKFMNKWIETWRESLDRNKHIASGKLYQSIGESWEFTVIGKKARLVLTLPAYYAATDTGRLPTKVTSGNGALYKALAGPGGWIAQKRIVASKGMTLGGKQLTPSEANQRLARAIAFKIHKYGFEGTKWFSQYLKQFEGELNNVISDIVSRGGKFKLEIFGKK